MSSSLSPWQQRIQIGGFQPFSTVDWPEKISATLFLQGCPWRCAYCHNPHLQTRQAPGKNKNLMSWEKIEHELQRRQGWLDGVVFSGGEPIADSALPEAIAHVRNMGYSIGLHTGGAYPQRLAKILPLLDWVGLDIKTAPKLYDELTGVPGSGDKFLQSAHLITTSGIDHEFRLTYHSELVGEDAVLRAADYAAALGCQHFVLQEYRSQPFLAGNVPTHHGISEELHKNLSARLPRFSVRSAC